MSVNVARFDWYRTSRLWVAPTLGALVALVLGTGLLVLDAFVLTDDVRFLPTFRGEPDTARSLLQTVATAITTLLALVLTIVTFVMQLASGHFTHRAVRTLLHDGHSHLMLAMFVGTITFALLGLLAFEATVEDGEVIGLTIPVGFALGVVSLGVFVSYIDHIVHRARGTTIIEAIGDETRGEIDRMAPVGLDEASPFPSGTLPDEEPQQRVVNVRPGVVLELDVDELVELARKADVVVAFAPAVGDFIPGGVVLLDVFGGRLDEDAARATIQLDPERTVRQDATFGLRLLVDVGEHAVSPSSNDPTTGVQVIDQLHDLLRRLGTRHLPTGWFVDGDGTPRLYVPQRAWEEYVELAFTELRHYGGSDVQVVRRLRAMALELLAVVPDHRCGPVRRQLELLDETVAGSFTLEADQRAAGIADEQGIGSRPATGGRDPDSAVYARSRRDEHPQDGSDETAGT